VVDINPVYINYHTFYLGSPTSTRMILTEQFVAQMAAPSLFSGTRQNMVNNTLAGVCISLHNLLLFPLKKTFFFFDKMMP
jgi:hypothetical protein